ncbi:MAG: hypothetical protein KZQ83_20950 [gamma proteobacterium symbiont of Taylorina sp.]|nr:hypothetical protein [gamma proteobacterium symbiont of Taylorina sp.]
MKEKLAIFCGISSKSYWHSSKTEGINKGLSNKYLKDLGLVSLKEKWVAIHYECGGCGRDTHGYPIKSFMMQFYMVGHAMLTNFDGTTKGHKHFEDEANDLLMAF